MFRCGICKEQSAPREKAVAVVTERRAKIYPAIPYAHKYTDRNGREIEKDDPGGEGTEIVTEVSAHSKCAVKTLEATA